MATKGRKITSIAPTRIDLAGGTIDIWPIFLLMKQPTTINLAIDLTAETILEELPDNRGLVILKTADQKSELVFDWDSIDTQVAPPALDLHLRFVKFFAYEKRKFSALDKRMTLVLSTTAKSPVGAGLGGSSALSISILGALSTWAKGPIQPERDGPSLIRVATDTETQVLQVPAGLQDYFAAMYGGLQTLHWRAGLHERSYLDHDLIPELQSRLLLFYSGQSRNSGINNWTLYKSFIDKEQKTQEKFKTIASCARQLEKALQDHDWAAVGTSISDEWNIRKTLSDSISTKEIDASVAAGFSEGAKAAKICGAGGGGCLFFYTSEPDKALQDRIIKRVAMFGLKHLPFNAAPRGLEVTVT